MSRPVLVLELRSVRGTGGGPEKTILMGAARANSAETAVTVCYLRDLRDRTFFLDTWAAGLGIPYIEVHERHSLDFSAWRRLETLVRDRQIDIVHAHEYKTDLIALWLRRRTGVIPLATAHGWTGQSTRERHLYYPADKRLLRRFPAVIAVSSEIKHELVRRGSKPERIEVILNAIDPTAFHRVPGQGGTVRKALGLDGAGFLIGAVGRLERQKRFDLLIAAFARVAATRPGLHLVIAGDGSLRQDLQALVARLNLESQCHLIGQHRNIAELHNAFDLLVQSSEYEGTPNVVLEAMAMNTPLIATDVGGTSELAIDGVHGLIVPVHDVDALVRAIEAVLRDPGAAATRAAAARRRVETDLSFDVRTRRLDGIYRRLAEGASVTPCAHA